MTAHIAGETPLKVLVEGWRFISHSYAMVNQWQMLAMLGRRDVALTIFDLPFLSGDIPNIAGLFDPQREDALRRCARAETTAAYDVCYRIAYPYTLRSEALSGARCGKTLVFGTAEYRHLTSHYLTETPDIQALNADPNFFVVTPSRWSADGFLNLGLAAGRVKIIPHGVDPAIFNNSQTNREETRKRLGLDGYVFMTCGTMTSNKGIDVLLNAFSIFVQKYGDSRLLLKGTDSLYASRELLMSHLNSLNPTLQKLVLEKIVYVGDVLSANEMARLYQSADAYVSPYRAEGFNLPVLEAAACGLPILCTKGGPTEDFVHHSFCWKIDSALRESEAGNWLEPDVHHMLHLMEKVMHDSSLQRAAFVLGPLHVAANYTWDNAVQKIFDLAG